MPQVMDLPETFSYKGWSIRYSLTVSPSLHTTSSSNQSKPIPIVFVHGTPWSSAVFLPTINTLHAQGSKPSRTKYQILAYDLPGYGQSQTYSNSSSTGSSPFQGDTSVAFQASALVALLNHTGLDNANPATIAHDIAGTIVLRAHLLHNVDFRSMMLCDANAVLPWGDGFYKLARAEYATFLKLPSGVFAAVVQAVTASAVHNKKVLEEGWGDVLAAPWIDGPNAPPEKGGDGMECGPRQRSYVRQIAQANDEDVRAMLEQDLYGNVRCDMKVLWGEEDKWIPRHKVEDLVKRMGHRVKEVAFVPEAGHLVMLDQPARFAVEVFDWLGR